METISENVIIEILRNKIEILETQLKEQQTSSHANHARALGKLGEEEKMKLLKDRIKIKERITDIFIDGPYGSSQDVIRLLNRLVTMAYTGLQQQYPLFMKLDCHEEVEIGKGDIEAFSFASYLNQQVVEYIVIDNKIRLSSTAMEVAG